MAGKQTANKTDIRIGLVGGRSSGKTTFLGCLPGAVNSARSEYIHIRNDLSREIITALWKIYLQGDVAQATAASMDEHSPPLQVRLETQDENWNIDFHDYAGNLIEVAERTFNTSNSKTARDELSQAGRKNVAAMLAECDALIFMLPVDLSARESLQRAHIYSLVIQTALDFVCNSEKILPPICVALTKWDKVAKSCDNDEAIFLEMHPVLNNALIALRRIDPDLTIWKISSFGSHSLNDIDKPQANHIQPYNILEILKYLCEQVAERNFSRLKGIVRSDLTPDAAAPLLDCPLTREQRTTLEGMIRDERQRQEKIDRNKQLKKKKYRRNVIAALLLVAVLGGGYADSRVISRYSRVLEEVAGDDLLDPKWGQVNDYIGSSFFTVPSFLNKSNRRRLMEQWESKCGAIIKNTARRFDAMQNATVPRELDERIAEAETLREGCNRIDKMLPLESPLRKEFRTVQIRTDKLHEELNREKLIEDAIGDIEQEKDNDKKIVAARAFAERFTQGDYPEAGPARTKVAALLHQAEKAVAMELSAKKLAAFDLKYETVTNSGEKGLIKRINAFEAKHPEAEYPDRTDAFARLRSLAQQRQASVVQDIQALEEGLLDFRDVSEAPASVRIDMANKRIDLCQRIKTMADEEGVTLSLDVAGKIEEERENIPALERVKNFEEDWTQVYLSMKTNGFARRARDFFTQYPDSAFPSKDEDYRKLRDLVEEKKQIILRDMHEATVHLAPDKSLSVERQLEITRNKRLKLRELLIQCDAEDIDIDTAQLTRISDELEERERILTRLVKTDKDFEALVKTHGDPGLVGRINAFLIEYPPETYAEELPNVYSQLEKMRSTRISEMNTRVEGLTHDAGHYRDNPAAPTATRLRNAEQRLHLLESAAKTIDEESLDAVKLIDLKEQIRVEQALRSRFVAWVELETEAEAVINDMLRLAPNSELTHRLLALQKKLDPVADDYPHQADLLGRLTHAFETTAPQYEQRAIEEKLAAARGAANKRDPDPEEVINAYETLLAAIENTKYNSFEFEKAEARGQIQKNGRTYDEQMFNRLTATCREVKDMPSLRAALQACNNYLDMENYGVQDKHWQARVWKEYYERFTKPMELSFQLTHINVTESDFIPSATDRKSDFYKLRVEISTDSSHAAFSGYDLPGQASLYLDIDDSEPEYFLVKTKTPVDIASPWAKPVVIPDAGSQVDFTLFSVNGTMRVSEKIPGRLFDFMFGEQGGFFEIAAPFSNPLPPVPKVFPKTPSKPATLIFRVSGHPIAPWSLPRRES